MLRYHKSETAVSRFVICILCIFSVYIFSGSAFAAGENEYINEYRLQQWMDAYIKEHNLEADGVTFSVGYCYLDTGDEWYYNGDKWLYPASLYKVPVAMLMAEQEASGLISQETVIGDRTVEYLESTALVYSDNDSGHAMIDYLGGGFYDKCSEQTMIYTDLPEEYYDKMFFEHSDYTARYITKVFKKLYNDNEQFPHVIEYLKEAHPEGYGQLMADDYEKAMKYGAFTDAHNKMLNHCSGIIYTRKPIIVTVMTRQVHDFKQIMKEIGDYLVNYSQIIANSNNYSLLEKVKASAQAGAWFWLEKPYLEKS